MLKKFGTVRSALSQAALALLAAAPLLSQAAPVCSRSVDLGTLSAGDSRNLGNQFVADTSFADCYNFSIGFSGNAQGSTAEANWQFGMGVLFGEIDVWSVALFRNSLQIGATDITPESFAFPSLSAGDYQLVVSGLVNPGMFGVYVEYTGDLSAQASPPSTGGNNVPEPASLALALGALAAAGAASRRRRPA